MRKKQPVKAVSTGSEEGMVASMTDGEGKVITGDAISKEAGLSGHKWLHMDVVERDKMEWMTDVTVEYGNSTQVSQQ